MIDGAERALSLTQHTKSERLLYLALRTDGWSTAAELAERVDIAQPTVSQATTSLEQNGWVTSRHRATGGRGRSPTEYHAMVVCEFCGSRFSVPGIAGHEPHCDEGTVTAYDVQDMDPEDLGLGDDKPEPERGLQ